MSPIVIFFTLVALLFGGSYVTKRRFGVLGLALAGGSVLAKVWGEEAGLLFSAEGLRLGTLSPENFSLVVILLLPAFALMLHGPRHDSSLQKIGAPFLFTLLALALALQPLQPLLTSSGTGIAIYRNLMQYRDLIVSVGVVLSLADIFFLKGSGRSKSDTKH